MGMLPHRGRKLVSKRYFLITVSHIKHRYHDLTDNKGNVSGGRKNQLPISKSKGAIHGQATTGSSSTVVYLRREEQTTN